MLPTKGVCKNKTQGLTSEFALKFIRLGIGSVFNTEYLQTFGFCFYQWATMADSTQLMDNMAVQI
jgi:hypothetical protein